MSKKLVKLLNSSIQGVGLIALCDISSGTFLGETHRENPDGWEKLETFGDYNHSSAPNSYVVRSGYALHLFTAVDIVEGEEVTVDYRKQPYLQQPGSDWIETPVDLFTNELLEVEHDTVWGISSGRSKAILRSFRKSLETYERRLQTISLYGDDQQLARLASDLLSGIIPLRRKLDPPKKKKKLRM